ncbi:flagellar biosynthesis protein FlhB [Anaerobacillus alkalidiazotrophicus]|uniref:Flagellar biosynthetic protein FlhB n=1 Tax=Anaerobacillus alkalidiazotrophicus TaxID=472963 RepID=A0A1S2M018_9BACI|nr:flagellar biosynthesis protein FlhB [Anaerobacillus alkalidiazotrophicus]OIJ17850.1 flagellar biosynthesis protein FlhB [Anaerobacillus alkalidiazotrophicus]
MPLLPINLQFFSQEKTEKATPKKRQETRKKGQVAKSTDINTAIILLLVFIILWLIGEYVGKRIFIFTQYMFQEYLLYSLSSENVESLFLELTTQAVMIVAPIMLIAMLAGILSNYLQVGFLFAPEAIKMKLSKLNPIQGFKRIYSIRAIVELLKSLLKICLVGLVTFTILWYSIDQILFLSLIPIADSLVFVGSLTVTMGVAVSILLIFLAVLDYMYQRYDHEKNIKMSKQDIKDEYKKTEGDPLIKSKIKEKQRQMAMKRMMQEVPKADVVITNPTHYAIALKYDGDKMDAPVVVAKGVDFLAQKIKAIAKHHEIITVENRPLARALYDQADIGDQVPEDLFKAVAEVLAYVYRIKNKV